MQVQHRWHGLCLLVTVGASACAAPTQASAPSKAPEVTKVQPPALEAQEEADTTPKKTPPSKPFVAPLKKRLRSAFPMCGFEAPCRAVQGGLERGPRLRWVSDAGFASNVGVEARRERPHLGQSILVGRTTFGFAVPNRSFQARPPGSLWHFLALLDGEALRPIDGLEGTGFVEAAADRAGRIHLATRGPAGRAGQYALYDDGEWQVSQHKLPPVASLGLDPRGQPWILSQNGRLVLPDGTHRETGLSQVRSARWAFSAQAVDILARAVVGDAKVLSLVVIHVGPADVTTTPVSDDLVFANDKNRKGIVAQSDLPRAILMTTEGLAVVYERNQTMGRVRCKKVACREWGPCKGRDCRLGRMEPECTQPGVAFNSMCSVDSTHIRARASLRARLIGRAAEDAVLVTPQWADRILVDFGDAHITVAIDVNTMNRTNPKVRLRQLTR